jgi:hypothetical protein
VVPGRRDGVVAGQDQLLKHLRPDQSGTANNHDLHARPFRPWQFAEALSSVRLPFGPPRRGPRS